jgi:hypothetical protein
LNALKSVIQSDVQAFRQLAGIPSKDDIWRERLWGFIFGIISSLVASGIFLWLTGIIS